jgi:hypothetical protein
MRVLDRLVEIVKIMVLCIGGSIAYGIIHDMVTAHVAVDYFTVYHPKVVDSQSPIVMALVWGVIATWWMGFGLGLQLAVASQLGSKPYIEAKTLVKPVIKLLAVTLGCSLFAGLLGYFGLLGNPGGFSEETEAATHRMIAVSLTHYTSYLIGFFGGYILIGWVLVKRVRGRASN